MKPLHKEDIKILDGLLEELLINGKLEKSSEYERYLEILMEWNAINVRMSGSTQDGIFMESEAVNTERLLKEGGFRKKYEEQKKKNDDIRLINRGNKANARISISKYWYYVVAIIIVLAYIFYTLFLS